MLNYQDMLVKISTQHFANGFGLFGDIEDIKAKITNCCDEEVEKTYRTCSFLSNEFSLDNVLRFYVEISNFDENLAKKRFELDDEIIKFLKNTIKDRKKSRAK